MGLHHEIDELKADWEVDRIVEMEVDPKMKGSADKAVKVLQKHMAAQVQRENNYFSTHK
jgi:hypothetical protein